jgi:hypothetical protein
MRKPTQQQIVVRYLAACPGEWVSSYDLAKKETAWGWLGSQGDRRARELALAGKYELDGVIYFIERRHLGKYAEYRVAFSQPKPTQHVTFVAKDGKRVAQLSLI